MPNGLDSPKGQRSPCDTAQNTLLPIEESDEMFQPFAYLQPFNHKARLAFDCAVDAIKDNPDLFAHARRNMSIEPARQVTQFC